MATAIFLRNTNRNNKIRSGCIEQACVEIRAVTSDGFNWGRLKNALFLHLYYIGGNSRAAEHSQSRKHFYSQYRPR